ncbi:uncharacterized protein METZ01_LOCUS349542, partial [marine metagenome]
LGDRARRRECRGPEPYPVTCRPVRRKKYKFRCSKSRPGADGTLGGLGQSHGAGHETDHRGSRQIGAIFNSARPHCRNGRSRKFVCDARLAADAFRQRNPDRNRWWPAETADGPVAEPL